MKRGSEFFEGFPKRNIEQLTLVTGDVTDPDNDDYDEDREEGKIRTLKNGISYPQLETQFIENTVKC